MICLLFMFLSLSSYQVVNCINDDDHLTQIPAEYSDCICHWTSWMNSDNPFNEDESDDESYRRLRSRGLEFCENPAALQCFNIGAGRLIDPSNSDTVTCDVDLGLKCNFFCDDYKIKVACCYCPPSPIGPTFQILSENNDRCLSVRNNTGSSPTMILTQCDESTVQQRWSWVSQSQIKNSMNQQCLKPNNSVVTTVDCDAADSQQWWSYDKSSKSLSSGYGYLSSRSGGYDSRASNSRWMAQVEIGKTDLKTMKGFPCEEEPSAPQNGSVSCSFGSYQGSVCQFSCDRGFELPSGSQNSITCLRNQQYSGATPACQRITCQSDLPSLSNGQVTCSDEKTYVDSECQFVCDEGYRLVGAAAITCGELGKWDNTLPTCERIVCKPDLENVLVDHGFVNCSNENYLSSTCGYRCEAGYVLSGSQVRVCGRDSTWDGTQPSCNKLRCPVILAPAKGKMKCGDENYYESTCTFSCNTGYTLVGRGSVSCSSEGKWGGDSPVCERKTCGSLVNPENGRLSCTDTSFFGSQCSYTCYDGYEIEGNSPLECTADGWDNGSPSCKRIECNHLLAPINGNITCSDNDFYDSRCLFGCNRFYDVVGPEVRVCNERGWNGTASPTCKKRTCPGYTAPPHGKVQCYPPGYEVDSACFVTCDEGYNLNSTSGLATCLENGKWENVKYTCKRIKCRRLTRLRDGSVDCSDVNNYKSKCQFRCNAGHNLYGSNETVCEANGWSEQTPTCDKIDCFPKFSQPINGNVQCSGKNTFSCTFSCKIGYNLVGVNYTECQNDGTWTNSQPPVCQKVRCSGGARAPSHGRMDCTDRNYYGSVCNYSCDHGYDLKGQNIIECMESGNWNSQPPTCQRISCTTQPTLNNGEVDCSDANHFDSQCTFTCDEGHQLIGRSSIRCLVNQTWSHRIPYCEEITCSPGFSSPSNGLRKCTNYNNLHSVCTFTCDKGFKLNGNENTACGIDGWSNKVAPTCIKIRCSKLEANFPDGSENCDNSNDLDSRCKYSCNEGYKLKGNPSRQCLESGEWSRERPRCTKIDCNALTSVKNGNTNCTHEYEYESECVFMCVTGYRRVGPEKVVCTRDKTWNPTEVAKCELIPTTTVMTTTTSPVTTTTPRSETSGSQSSKPIAEPPNSVVEPNQTNPESTTSKTGVTTTKANQPPETKPTTDGDGFPVIVVAVSVAVLALVIIIGGVIFVCYRKRRMKKRPSFKGISLRDRLDDSHLQKLLTPNGSSSGRRFPPTLVDRLESEFSRKHADDDKLFREEFASLPEGQGSREQGGKAINKDKNRYTNVIPYDHSRVVLPRASNNDPDYINASFIDGYKHKGKFIAAQGPKENTTNDFWRMIWDQNVTTVIMVTNLTEGKETKCAQYWPHHGSHLYCDLNVCFTGENRLVDYTVRKFTIQQVSGESTLSMRRNLVQYHFTSWPDFGVPKSPSGMLKFLRKIKHGSPTGYGAIVVHCSAGVGRTGTFICLDAMLDMMNREGKIDVYGFVTQMRGQRPEMVQTEQQYIFIYQAILEQHLYGDTEIEAADITLHLDELNKRLPGNVTGMEHEFKKLTTIRIQKEHMRAGNHPGNMRKNRVLLILPYDWNRVILPVKRGEENSDYINASYIDGYRQKDAYIATQGPLAHTVEDFWRMIWQTQSSSIVMLTELVERGQTKCEQYWPDSDVTIYGDISVENISAEQSDYYSTRDFVLTSTTDQNDRKQIVRQFHYHAWPESGPPVSGYSMIALVEQVQKQQQTSGNHPITIHCSAGAGRTGAFCALSTALEQVKAEGVLDMFQIVKCLRMQRPHMVQNLEQYEFCYRAVQEYVDSMSEYYNFK